MRVDLAGFTRGSKSLDHAQVLDLCARCDRLGYDGIWFNEFHFQQPPDPYPSTLLLAAAILARTERLRVGTSIAVLPIYHPFLLAEQVAQLHWQSGGRFDFGVGRGTHPVTLETLGIAPEATRALFAQSLDLIVSAWTRPTAIVSGGPWPASAGHSVGPLLAEGAQIPVYVAGTMPETIGLAIARDLPLLLSLEPSEERQLALHAALRGGQADPRRADHSISRYVMIGRTQAEAMTRVDALLPRLHQRRLRFARAQNRPIDTIRPIDRSTFLARQMIAGDPEQCFLRLRALEAETGIASIRLVFNCNGEIAEDEAEADAGFFARTVLPALKALPRSNAFQPHSEDNRSC